MKKFEKELLFSQVEGETTTGSGNGSTGENAGEGENDQPEQEPTDEGAEADSNMYEGQDGSSSGQTSGEGGNTSTGQTEGEQSGKSQSEHPTENDSEFGWDLAIDDVIIIGTPPAENEEEPDEDEGDGYENTDVNEDDTKASTEQSEEEKTKTEKYDEIVITVPPLKESLTSSRPEPVKNGFCLLGCCRWALYRIFGVSPNFNFMKAVADYVTRNGFNGIGYSNVYDKGILENLCSRYYNELQIQLFLSFRIFDIPQGAAYPDITSYIPTLQYYLDNNVGVIGIYSTSNYSEHAVLITDIDENGYYTYIDPVTTIETAGEKKLEDSGFDRFYNIVYR